MNHYYNKPSGISLIETLISMCVVCIGALAVVNLQSKLLQNTTQVGQQAEALLLAEDKLESLRNIASINQYEELTSGSDKKASTNTNFIRNWYVQNYNNPTYKSITVNVSWLKANGTAQNISLNSQIVYKNFHDITLIMQGKH